MIETPAYIFDKAELVRCYRRLADLLCECEVYYALKANSEPGVLLALKKEGVTFEASSLGEFETLCDIGVDASEIICSLPVKPRLWIQRMHLAGCNCFAFDSVHEYEKFADMGIVEADLILRLQVTDFSPECIDFGMNLDEAKRILKHDAKNRRIIGGISFHLSENTRIDRFLKATSRAERVLDLVARSKPILNIGGGYRLNAESGFYEVVNSKIASIKRRFGVRCIAEPGNAIVNSSGTLLARVVEVRRMDEYSYDVFIDAGKPSGFKTDAKRIPAKVTVSEGAGIVAETRSYRFIDITCMHRPHFEWKSRFVIEEGSIISLHGMGAYSVCLSNTFHAWPRPKVEVR